MVIAFPDRRPRVLGFIVDFTFYGSDDSLTFSEPDASEQRHSCRCTIICATNICFFSLHSPPFPVC